MNHSCYAKINLHLSVLYKRNDGYHEIESLFQEISLKDELILETREKGIQITATNPDIPLDSSNLVYRAADLLNKTTDIDRGCCIHIIKNIPLGAGLGGGSSNAASTLKILNTLWQCHLNNSALLNMAAQIGSDVPFFINGGTAIATGRGEKLDFIHPEVPYWGVLVYPDIHISTADIYRAGKFSLTKTNKNCKFRNLADIARKPYKWKQAFCNDLEPVVLDRYPELMNIRRELEATGAFYTRMSGSGSGFYGLYSDANLALKAQTLLTDRFKTFLFEPIYRI